MKNQPCSPNELRNLTKPMKFLSRQNSYHAETLLTRRIVYALYLTWTYTGQGDILAFTTPLDPLYRTLSFICGFLSDSVLCVVYLEGVSSRIHLSLLDRLSRAFLSICGFSSDSGRCMMNCEWVSSRTCCFVLRGRTPSISDQQARSFLPLVAKGRESEGTTLCQQQW